MRVAFAKARIDARDSEEAELAYAAELETRSETTDEEVAAREAVRKS